MINFPKDQWEEDKQEFKTFFKDWGNQWKSLGRNALIPIVILLAFFGGIGYIIFTGH